ncbi:YdcF family protein [Variovorax sp. J22G21]|uniref:YdcF family protein n=1 Tax=Variovorax fucosicus TaxID=3053517 RepID=UPI002576D831|nr:MULTISPECIES: YdcF family protein [unclassified Variovorax]MDM0038420.1 YdcF family protein [Variovorax sp. J22R193]MDM0063196.1 YdcF family protein [Variovorax sp. J22G21]
MSRRLRSWLRPLLAAFVVLLLGYAAIWATVWQHARAQLAQPPTRTAEVALVLGNRAWLRGKPNPCLTGRVDTAVALAQAGTVQRLLMSGGVDREDGRIEAEVMEHHARQIGYAGPVQLEAVSSSTRQNLSMSRALLQAAGVRSVVVVSEPYHLWRVERLARASGFDREFDVQYAAAPSSCWRSWGMVFKGALREPLAIVNNGLNGYF